MENKPEIPEKISVYKTHFDLIKKVNFHRKTLAVIINLRPKPPDILHNIVGIKKLLY